MNFVRKIEYGEKAMIPSSWEDVEKAISRLAAKGDPGWGLSLIGETADVWMIVHYVPDYGFYISGSGVGDLTHYTVVDHELGDDVIDVWVAGAEGEYLRCCFVSKEITLCAIREFYESGARCSKVSWEEALDVSG